MSLTFTPAAAPSLKSEDLRNPLGKGGMSRCVFDEAFTRKMGYLTAGQGPVGVSKGGRFVLGRKERSVGIWRVLGDEAGWEKVLEMDLRVSHEHERSEWRVDRVHLFGCNDHSLRS
jgi:U3 small nucleolar RNA-associated protein 4